VDYNLIVSVNDLIRGPTFSYSIQDIIGQGVSGQVFKCTREHDGKPFAMKIIKSKKAYNTQALIELKILEFLNNEVDRGDLHHIIRLYDNFFFKEHLCIVFELLNENLYELLKQNYFQGISLNSIQFIIKQILEAVYQLQKANLIHCDLKPENVLLKFDKESPKNDIVIKITDFGSACFKNHTMFEYIQSRYYRAPEVLLGAKYCWQIDMWSIGCIAAELFLGEPLLPGSCEYDQIAKIDRLFGTPPQNLLRGGKKAKKFYTSDFKLKNLNEYYKEFQSETEPRYEIPWDLKSLDDLIFKNQNKKVSSNSELEIFIHFLKGLLEVDPNLRWNAKTALRHPFITKEKLDCFTNCNEDYSFFPLENNSHMSYLSGPHMNQTMFYPSFQPHSLSMTHNSNCSVDMSVYHPDIKSIPLNLLKNFPYAKIGNMNLKPQKKIQNKFDNKYNNNSFMKTTHDEIFLGSSFQEDKTYKGPHHRYFKDDMQIRGNKNKNKYTAALNNLRSHNKKINPQNNFNYVNNKQGYLDYKMMMLNENGNLFLIIEMNLNMNKNINKSLFYNARNFNFKDYEGLYPHDVSNRSFDQNNRTRSKSDYYNQNFLNFGVSQMPNQNINKNNFLHVNYNTNALNYSNYSTHANDEKLNLNKK
jgi:dual specificity protein kinase YAK1